MQNIIQTVIFKLQPYVLADEFIRLAGRRYHWLSAQQGFISYELSEGEDGWCERIVWQDMDAASQASQLFMLEKTYQQLELLIDDQYTGLFSSIVLEGSAHLDA